MTVQLISMESTAAPVTCMTSCMDKPVTLVGLSSGQMLLVSVTSNSKPGTNQASEDVTSADSAQNGSESIDSSSAALTFATLPEQHAAAVTAAQLSSDGRKLATISATDGAVFVWDTFAGSAADLYLASRAIIAGAACPAWLPDGRLLLGSSNNQLVVSPHFTLMH